MTSPEPQRFARLTDRVVLVSIDGLRPQIYRMNGWRHRSSTTELDRLGAYPEAALALAATPGVVFSPDPEGQPVQAAHGAGHGYVPVLRDMMTGFLASGAGVRAGAVIPQLPLENVAPFVAALLELDLPDVDGVLFPGLLSTAPEVAASRRP